MFSEAYSSLSSLLIFSVTLSHLKIRFHWWSTKSQQVRIMVVMVFPDGVWNWGGDLSLSIVVGKLGGSQKAENSFVSIISIFSSNKLISIGSLYVIIFCYCSILSLVSMIYSFIDISFEFEWTLLLQVLIESVKT